MLKFIVTIRSHRLLGYLLVPYMVEETPNQEFFKIKESLVLENVSSAPEMYAESHIAIAKLANEYSDAQIRNKFGSKKNSGASDFPKSVDPDLLNDHIRPYVDSIANKILDLCIESNIKVFFRNDNTNSIFPDDEVIVSSRMSKAVFNFVRTDEETRYFLSVSYKSSDINLLGKNVYVLSNSPCNILIDNRIYRFDDIDAKKLLPFVSKEYIPVAKRVESQYYQKFVKNAIASNSVVRASGFKIVNDKTSPKAVLSVENDISGDVVFCLKFRYKDIEFLPTSPNLVVVKFFENNGDYYFTKLVRDIQYETEVEEAATRIFGRRYNGVGTYKLQITGGKELQQAVAIRFVGDNSEQFAEAGIVVEVVGSQKNYYTGKIDVAVNVQRQNDWFDVHAIVKLDDMEFPFIALKNYILNDIREFQLPDGRVVVLPDEWFVRYRDVFASGSIIRTDNLIRLYNYQYNALMSLPLEGSLQERITDMEKHLADIGRLPNTQPVNVEATLRPYQVTGFNWLKMMRDYGFGACLADDMGLGKTLCTLSLLSESTVHDGEMEDGLFTFSKKIPSLLVVPKSLIYNWISEAHKFVPHLKFLEFTGSNRLEYVKSFPLYDVVITGYGTLRNDVEVLSKYRFNYIVLDESQTVKNPTSKTYQSLMELSCEHRLALTGTPLENSLSDLWAQINFINPGILGNIASFKRRYITPIEKNCNEDVSARLRHLIYPFILRRTKQQVLNDLPELMEQTIMCDMTEAQQKLYTEEKSKTRNSILEIVDRGVFDKSTVMVLQSLTKLRQLACAPYMIDDTYEGGSGKTEEIMRALQNVILQGHKVLVFSSFVKHLEIIAKSLRESDIEYCMLTGATEHREQEVRRFADNGIPVFLISIKAGGTGLNLTLADYVFIIDPWWNPAVEDQAIARAHRMGQKNAVMVYRFISRDTVEEKIRVFQKKKAGLAMSFVSETTTLSPDLKEEVLRILE